jgi:hypothetical protein
MEGIASLSLRTRLKVAQQIGAKVVTNVASGNRSRNDNDDEEDDCLGF